MTSVSSMFLILSLFSAAFLLVEGQQCLSRGDQFTIEDDGCDQNSFVDALEDFLERKNCDHGPKTELRHIFGSEAAAKSAIDTACADGWAKVDTSTYSDVDNRFTNSFMNEYVAGGTFLNSKFP